MKHFLLVIAVTVASLATAGLATPVYAANTTNSPTDSASNSVCAAIGCTDKTRSPDIGSVIKIVLNILSFVVGFVAVIMIVVNGFRFVTSSGEASKVASARSGILYALIGLAVAALAQVLVHFVISQVNSSTKPASSKSRKK